MKRRQKRLSLNGETLRRLDNLAYGAIVGAGPTPTDVSACKMDTHCGNATNDPDLCVASWLGNCYTLTCNTACV